MIDLAALRPFLDDHAYPMAVDWLQEHGATLADLLLAYRGEPPEYLGRSFEADEGLRLLLGEWCRATEPERLVGRGPFDLPDEANRFRWARVLACEVDWVEVAGEVGFGLEHRGRAMSLADRLKLARLMVERMAEKGIVDRVRVANDPLLAAGVAGADAAFQERARTAAASARREQKRRVLGLFPEVWMDREVRIDNETVLRLRNPVDRHAVEVVRDRFRTAGFLEGRDPGPFWRWVTDCLMGTPAVSAGDGLSFRHDMPNRYYRFRWTLAAPDWIPPEPIYGPSPMMDLYRRFRESGGIFGDGIPR